MRRRSGRRYNYTVENQLPDLEQRRTTVRGTWPYADKEQEKLRRLYVERGLSTGEVGRIMGASGTTVYRAVKRLGWARSQSESAHKGWAKRRKSS
jgi:hypothetical protein